MTNELIKKLLEEYLTEDICEQHRQQLLMLLDNPDELDFYLRNKFEEDVFANENFYASGFEEKLKASLLKEINHQPAKLKRFSRRFVAVAASIIGIISLSTGYFFYKNVQNEKIAQLQSLAPGKDGAILTLANGKQIILDSLQNGSFAEKDSTLINKKDGMLVYNAENSKDVVYNTISTPKGRQFSIKLADGTKVMLNAESSIHFPTNFLGDVREVSTTGEVYFEVAKNAGKKFIVHTGDMATEVMGTHFVIKNYADEDIKTATLLEGSIKVSRQAVAQVLAPGNQLQIDKTGATHFVKNANLDEASGWISGYFYFEKATIQEVMKQLMRWYDVEVVYQGKLSKELFGGKIERNLNLAEVMDILKIIGIKYKVNGRTIAITGA